MGVSPFPVRVESLGSSRQAGSTLGVADDYGRRAIVYAFSQGHIAHPTTIDAQRAAHPKLTSK